VSSYLIRILIAMPSNNKHLNITTGLLAFALLFVANSSQACTAPISGKAYDYKIEISKDGTWEEYIIQFPETIEEQSFSHADLTISPETSKSGEVSTRLNTITHNGIVGAAISSFSISGLHVSVSVWWQTDSTCPVIGNKIIKINK